MKATYAVNPAVGKSNLAQSGLLQIILYLVLHCVIMCLKLCKPLILKPSLYNLWSTDSRLISAVMQMTWHCTSTLVSMMTLMVLCWCATQRLLVAGAMKNGKFTTPYRGVLMSRWGNVIEVIDDVLSVWVLWISQEGFWLDQMDIWFTHIKHKKHTNTLADIKLGDEGWVGIDCVLEKMFSYEFFFCFRLCWNWLKTRLKWNFLMDRKSSFQIVLVWVPSATSESQETLNWNPSRSAKRYNCKQMLCLTL